MFAATPMEGWVLIAFDPGGDRLAVSATTSEGKPQLALWDLTGKEFGKFETRGEMITALAFHLMAAQSLVHAMATERPAWSEK